LTRQPKPGLLLQPVDFPLLPLHQLMAQQRLLLLFKTYLLLSGLKPYGHFFFEQLSGGYHLHTGGSRVALSLRIRCDPNGLIYDETLFSLRWATLGSYPQL
jgi:ABC-type nitrate/sulfonate/bicarbonate transport system ATPase subunit